MARRRDRPARTRRPSRADRPASPPGEGAAAATAARTRRPADAGATLAVAARLTLLIVVAARPLILDSYSSARLGPAIDLREIYFLGPGPALQLPDDDAFVRLLVARPVPPGRVSVTVPAGTTVDARAFTPSGVPGTPNWQTGPWSIHVPVVDPDAAIELSVGVQRVDEAGVPQGPMHVTAAQPVDETRVYQFAFAGLGWATGTAADRIQVVYRFVNRSDMTATVILETGGAQARVTTPGVHLATLPGPMLTVGFDALILIALVLYALSVARSGQWVWCRTGAEAGTAILFTALVVSTSVAGNKWLAVVGAVDFACLVTLTLLLTQLLRRPWHLRLALCVIVATATVSAVRCVEQLGEFDDTIAQYAQSEAESWAAGGRGTDDPVARLFRSRLLARDPTGYMAHPNIAGSYLMLAAFAAAGLAAAKFKAPPQTFRRLFASLTAALAVLLAFAVGLTSARGAVVAGAGAIVALVVLRRARDRLVRHGKRIVAAGWLCVLVGAMAVAGVGRVTGSLPSASLAFRWQYWSNSWPLIRSNLLGVGTGQFGPHYLRHKTVKSPDEVSNAHNLFVQAASEWGVLGLAGLFALLAGVSLTLASPGPQPAAAPDARNDAGPPGRVLPHALGLTIAVIVLFAAATYGTTAAHLLLATALPAVIFPIAFMLSAIDSDRLDRFDDGPVPAAFGFVCAGLFAFCVHNFISFSLYVPAAATPFFALAAIALSLRGSNHVTSHRALPTTTRMLLPAGAVTATAAFVVLVGLPMMRGGWKFFQARTAARFGVLPDDPARHRADELFSASAAAAPSDPVPPSDWARWLTEYPYGSDSVARAGLDRAADLVRRAIDADRHNPRLYRQLSGVLAAQFGWTADARHLRDAVAAAEAVVRRYPESPQDQLSLAQLYDELFSATADGQDARTAIDAYRQALALDDRRPDYEVRRFSTPVRNAAEGRLRLLERAGRSSATSRPQ